MIKGVPEMFEGALRSAIIALASLTLLTCDRSPEFDDPRSKAKAVADAHLKAADFYDADLPVSVEDAGSEWLVIYQPRQGWIGGNTSVRVNKRTMQVTDTVASQ